MSHELRGTIKPAIEHIFPRNEQRKENQNDFIN